MSSIIIYRVVYCMDQFCNIVQLMDLWVDNKQMQLNKSTFLTADNNNPVIEAYKDLNKMIDDMDKKVEHVIKKHESQFLYAYRNHIAKIKKELTQIKHKSEQQEKMFSSNQRIQYLEKEMVIFREEALKLYNKLDQKTQENQLLKNRVKDYEKQQEMQQYNQKEKRKSMKMEEISRTMMQAKLQELEETIEKKDQEIAKLNKKIEVLKEETHRRSIMDYKVTSFSTNRRGESLRESQKVKRPEVYDSEMKEWFLDCIRTVKKEIAMRNSNNIMIELTHVTSIDEFKTVDKLRLLQLLLQNEKLLSWLYERIFPDRLSELRYKLSSHSEKQSNSEKEIKDVQDFNIGQFETRLLPKVGRAVKSELRSSFVMKNGKLNISHFDRM